MYVQQACVEDRLQHPVSILAELLYFLIFLLSKKRESDKKKIISLNRSLRSNKEKITEIWVSLVYMRLYFV